MPKPWLSILLPTYNGASFLPEALQSLREQGMDDIEIIAVDDDSSDGTLAILEQAARDMPLRIVPGPRRKNWVASVNVALREARGELASILHQDDGYLPRRLHVLREHAQHWPDAVLYTHWAEFRDNTGRRLGLWRAPFDAPLMAAGSLNQRLLIQNFFAVAAPMFRVQRARELGGMDERLWYTADWDFWLKLANAGETVCISEALAFFRLHSGSQTIQRSCDAKEFRQQLELVLERHLPLLRPANDQSAYESVRAAARVAIEINIALASIVHGSPLDYVRIASALRGLSVGALLRLLRDSRLHERVPARLRAAGLPALSALTHLRASS